MAAAAAAELTYAEAWGGRSSGETHRVWNLPDAAAPLDETGSAMHQIPEVGISASTERPLGPMASSASGASIAVTRTLGSLRA